MQSEMFRKPREEPVSTSDVLIQPSVGRPPTPPSIRNTILHPPTAKLSKMMPMPTPTQLSGRSGTMQRTGGESRGFPANKTKSKPNGSILSFFKKTDSPVKGHSREVEEDGLFFADTINTRKSNSPLQVPTPPWEGCNSWPGKESDRHNENRGSVKRRRINSQDTVSNAGESGTEQEVQERNCEWAQTTNSVTEATGFPDSGRVTHQHDSIQKEDSEDVSREDYKAGVESYKSTRAGPFMEDSEDDNDDTIRQMTRAAFDYVNPSPIKREKVLGGEIGVRQDDKADYGILAEDEDDKEARDESLQARPAFLRAPTSIVGGDGFEGIEDFIDDEFPEDGEEYIARRWMEREQEFEDRLDDDGVLGDISAVMDQDMNDEGESEKVQNIDTAGSCPICSANLAGITAEQASVHVNHCLDGHPIPLLEKDSTSKGYVSSAPNLQPHKRFQRAAIAKPGQENPFRFGASKVNGSSAFSKLMSSHAEDAAWATAAANENQARGKPAYKRTCPFYKILPGFFTCVDAFRYGAVEGCNAYFLSHFHSDHYIGLTSSWCHGPIYCSRVTANLVRRQLRVDPKWVVDLEFEQKFRVPGTQGVDVTMISANHCPGSSLFLFEKIIGKGKNPKCQRVLHCGDFRACPAHVQHPLLRPDVIDAVSGKQTGQQKLDVCYLDTTYLTPRYAFPSQEEVIKACADMCVSLSKDKVDNRDGWEQTKKERAGSGMVNFIRRESDTKQENNDTSTSPSATKRRGRLLVIVGTYSIGKERICLGVARALKSKIYAPPTKQKICAALEDPELTSLLTSDPYEAQVHMQMLMEIRAETLADYLTTYKPAFSRIVGFRPSGWNYRPPTGRFVESPAVQTVLHSDNWKSRYSMAELVPQRGSTREASCYGVPYSEHSSFRELSMFCCALRIDKIIPTVNVGSAKSREKMKGWIERWAMDKKKNGLFRIEDGKGEW